MTGSATDGVAISSFACTFGDVESRPEDLPGFADRWRQLLPDTPFASMGSGTFSKFSGPVAEHVVDCVAKVLAGPGLSASEVDHLVVATSDACLARLGPDFAARVLQAAGLTRCVPAVVSFQQCCSSLAALRYGRQLFDDDTTRHVVLVALDFTPDDLDRVRTFAVFGDAVAGCLISRTTSGPALELLESALTVDHSGLVGEDTFRSRQQVARSAMDTVLGRAGTQLEKVTKVFASNLYVPVATFNAMAVGVPRSQLHFQASMQRYGHCGNADWIINLLDHAARDGIGRGQLYLAQASAPGFFACGLLQGC